MKIEEFKKILGERVLVLDGAMGTMIQRLGLKEKDYRGKRFSSSGRELLGNNDLLSITRPDAIAAIHRAYIEAGADIISTNSFNANSVSLRDYAMSDRAAEINEAAASLARGVADDAFKKTGHRIFVAGSMGPTNRAASMSPVVDDPAFRNITFDELAEAYDCQAGALIKGGVDILLLETAFDTINLKAALEGSRRAMLRMDREMPIMVSLTISDKGGHILSGQTIDAVIASIENDPHIASVGLNCSFGPKDIIPHLEHLAEVSPFAVSCHPNAGHPDELGRYLETPETFCSTLKPEFEKNIINIAGGCCGTTPEHISMLAKIAHSSSPRLLPEKRKAMILSGLDVLDTRPGTFTIVGERCNVAGSRKFLRLIKEENFEEALRIAAKQVADGAVVIDINMDDPLLDAPAAMERFLRLAGTDPDIAKVPFMIDSSNWRVVETALKNIQGKSIVNSISLKEGEEDFIRKARFIKNMGAAVVVMAFDEEGQATTYSRKTAICGRAYGLLTEKVGFNPYDIIFDPNIMSVATGVEEHNLYARDFIEATRWIKRNLPGAKVSGGVSNLSFAFRGKNALREAMHCVFLHHAILAGMDMAIVNPSSLLVYDDIDPKLRGLLDDVMLYRRKDAAEELSEYALNDNADASTSKEKPEPETEQWRSENVSARLRHAVVAGISDYLETDIKEALDGGNTAVSIIEGPMMEAMGHVGYLFGEGRMFLPQVVKTARTMKMAVDILRPYMERENSAEKSVSAGKILFATVKGDVHDIGKNIVEIVLECNNYDVVDLGVMVPAETIVEEARRLKPDIICLSGLITPSLGEMSNVAEALERAGLDIPLMVGGAATSREHTALKIAPLYSAPVMHVRDAAQNPLMASALLNPSTREKFVKDLLEDEERIRRCGVGRRSLVSFEDANVRPYRIDWKKWNPCRPTAGVGTIHIFNIDMEDLIPFVNWNFLFMAWRVTGRFLVGFPYGKDVEKEKAWLDSLGENRQKGEQALSLYHDSLDMLNDIREGRQGVPKIRAVVRFCEANSRGNDIVADGNVLPMLRNQNPDREGRCVSLADMVMPESEGRNDYIGLFCVSVSGGNTETEASDSYQPLLWQTLRDRLAEAASEWLHRYVRTELWGYARDENLSVDDMIREKFTGIRPAVGYPAIPDQLLMKRIADMIPVEKIGVKITENGAMNPSSTVAGIYLSHPSARYFMIDAIAEDQLNDYSRRVGTPKDRLQSALCRLL